MTKRRKRIETIDRAFAALLAFVAMAGVLCLLFSLGGCGASPSYSVEYARGSGVLGVRIAGQIVELQITEAGIDLSGASYEGAQCEAPDPFPALDPADRTSGDDSDPDPVEVAPNE